MKAILALADGRVFHGQSIGAVGETFGEVVFNTSMSGYQEILTDPSYHGEIVTMTYPQIGNYGVNKEDVESDKPHLAGFVVKESCEFPSNWRSELSLNEYLQQNNIVGIQGIDTRALVKHIRDHGAQTGVISTVDLDVDSLVEKARKAPGLVGRDLVKEVTTAESYTWTQGVWDLEKGYTELVEPARYHVVAYDFGIKRNILRNLVSAGCRVTVVPASTSASDVLALNPDGVFLSNGPGDPEPITYAQENIRQLLGKVPLFGICLGHQLLAIALGGTTYKLKFGHRGGNQPVQRDENKRVEITSQNHGFAVDAQSLESASAISHLNLNDNTVEGLCHSQLPAFSVQYHPEASPGPHDAHYLFDRFISLMEDFKKNEN
ncbi:glutamine-hydrolyzing carbamoyl-phosphate synthase small subunit [Desulfuromonas acetoxidans]|uniref:Carbamoyl phosphate synthase small chain n=1 Tax=Desulfuromonas acetoxidans (strain DSM 684 / 11070) TaxID=281689 RepID=Q1K1T5_DESA6|nr:glutamine-hydrolyzing carbamoyl-phosphate synthase small subunit [Desulfuromonas acetoxidans]EAT16303.1 carbamoyl-phosphate synthase, small subunit [Desulfuromonas acetoxidans DSM 684]MBF0644890.1 glutamine-hydrolyzing carbamoyl-phosphate synthase small subunit [Desulfuromonas acetoxidans]NVD25407.1 glutamine-hydrolyzing carbamoyl-phosphate synthase small subunit [Desulfuromonas acetoxidans]NVE17492.1 glutamine-hydrolyzing carbamoyl-phosphate synthase small subunit [Desulfuromonas acetoxidan